MNKTEFLKRKEKLISLLNDSLKEPDFNIIDEKLFEKLLKILNEYSYENRLLMKGSLSHVIIDSLEINFKIGEMFIIFDNDIT